MERSRGCVRISFKHLATVLGFQVDSIYFIETDNIEQALYLYHTDEKIGMWRVSEDSQIPCNTLTMNHFAPAWASILKSLGWTVTPPTEENTYETNNM